MNNKLWNQILAYDLDSPLSEYGFSTRIAKENYWTQNFTKKAILEYKKFMYLAATSDFMVSPSEIVDVVWHQHLIFTQSYQDFCGILGKQIQHVPSTHNRDEFEKFRTAKERTKKLYAEVFGEQPENIWEYSDMYASLELEKADRKIRTFILLGILVFIVLTVPFFLALRPLYVRINSFMFGYITFSGLALAALEVYNIQYLSDMVNNIKRSCFLFELQPMEVLYLKTDEISHVVNGATNKLVIEKKIIINPDHSLCKSEDATPVTTEDYQVLEFVDKTEKVAYSALLKILKYKPVFTNTANCMDAFKKYFIKSKKFGNLFYLNFVVLSAVIMLGFIRFLLGVVRDRPVTLIGLFLIFITVISIMFLLRLTKSAFRKTIPQLYREILRKREDSQNWEWQYFLSGPSVLTAAFVPVLDYTNRYQTASPSDGSSSSSSCGSSCGSSCSSCGGCGGGD
jgi:hypothetical protein